MLPDLGGLVFMAIMGTVMTIGFFALTFAWLIMHVMTPRPSKQVTHASWLHRVILILFQGNRVAEILQAEIRPQGYLVTKEKKPRRFPIFKPSYKPPDKHYEDATLQTEEDQMLKLYYERAAIEQEIIPAYTIRGTRVPCYIGFAGIAVAFTPQAVLAASYTEQVVDGEIKTEEGKTKTLKVVLPFNPASVQKHMPKLLNQIDVDASYEDGREEGRREAQNPGQLKLFLYGGLAMMILGAAMLAIAVFLG